MDRAIGVGGTVVVDDDIVDPPPLFCGLAPMGGGGFCDNGGLGKLLFLARAAACAGCVGGTKLMEV